VIVLQELGDWNQAVGLHSLQQLSSDLLVLVFVEVGHVAVRRFEKANLGGVSVRVDAARLASQPHHFVVGALGQNLKLLLCRLLLARRVVDLGVLHLTQSPGVLLPEVLLGHLLRVVGEGNWLFGRSQVALERRLGAFEYLGGRRSHA
jgi:hypothetical protein